MPDKIIQKELLLILKIIDNICKEENLIYMIYAGTLLGAVREKGFIEWDDDADIMMPRSSYDVFEECCEKYLNSEGLFLDYHDRVPKVAFIKNPQIHVDIFLIDSLPQNKLKRKCKIMKLKFLQGMMKTEVDYSRYKNSIEKLLVFGSSLIGKFFSCSTKLDYYKKISRIGNEENSTLVFLSNALYRFMNLELDKHLLEEVIRIAFEDTSLMAPKNWDAILKLQYGNDYMTPKRENYFV